MSGERPGTVERAFELARTGKHQGVSEIVSALKRERHDAVDAHLAGPAIRKALRQACEAAAKGRAAAVDEPMGQASPQSA